MGEPKRGADDPGDPKCGSENLKEFLRTARDRGWEQMEAAQMQLVNNRGETADFKEIKGQSAAKRGSTACGGRIS